MQISTAIIGGTGFDSAIAEHFGNTPEIEEVSTEYGAISLSIFNREGTKIAFMARHGKGHSIPPHQIDHRANIAALKAIGVREIISTSAVGSLKNEIEPGDIVIPDDFIDLRGGLPTTFFDSAPVTHTDFSEPFSRRLRGLLLQSVEMSTEDMGIAGSIIHPSGVYLCMAGPRYETPAEVRYLGAMGGDIVGMTVAAEAILARELGLEYASISVVTNYGTGLAAAPLDHLDVEEMMRARRPLIVGALINACTKAQTKYE